MKKRSIFILPFLVFLFIFVFAISTVSLVSATQDDAYNHCPDHVSCPTESDPYNTCVCRGSPPTMCYPAAEQKGYQMKQENSEQPTVDGTTAKYSNGIIKLQDAKTEAQIKWCKLIVDTLQFTKDACTAVSQQVNYCGSFAITLDDNKISGLATRKRGEVVDWSFTNLNGMLGDDGGLKGASADTASQKELTIKGVKNGEFPVQGDYIFKGSADEINIKTLTLNQISQANVKNDYSISEITAGSATLNKVITFTTITKGNFDTKQNFEGKAATLKVNSVTYTTINGKVYSNGNFDGTADSVVLTDGTKIDNFDGTIDSSGTIIRIRFAETITKEPYTIKNTRGGTLTQSGLGLTLTCHGCSTGQISNKADFGHIFTVNSASGQIIIAYGTTTIGGASQGYWAKIDGFAEVTEAHSVNFQTDRKITDGTERLIYYDGQGIAKGLVGGKGGNDFLSFAQTLIGEAQKLLGQGTGGSNPSMETKGDSSIAYNKDNKGLNANIYPQGNALARVGNIATEGCNQVSLDLTQTPIQGSSNVNCAGSQVAQVASGTQTNGVLTNGNEAVHFASITDTKSLKTSQIPANTIIDGNTAQQVQGISNTLTNNLISQA